MEDILFQAPILGMVTAAQVVEVPVGQMGLMEGITEEESGKGIQLESSKNLQERYMQVEAAEIKVMEMVELAAMWTEPKVAALLLLEDLTEGIYQRKYQDLKVPMEVKALTIKPPGAEAAVMEQAEALQQIKAWMKRP